MIVGMLYLGLKMPTGGRLGLHLLERYQGCECGRAKQASHIGDIPMVAAVQAIDIISYCLSRDSLLDLQRASETVPLAD